MGFEQGVLDVITSDINGFNPGDYVRDHLQCENEFSLNQIVLVQSTIIEASEFVKMETAGDGFISSNTAGGI
jgi:hypothetical protein